MAIAPWFLPSLLSLVLWGVSVFLPKIAVRTLPPLHLAVYSNIAFCLGTLVVIALHGFHLEFDPRGAVIAISVGILGGIGQLFFIYAIQHGPMSYGAVATALYPLVTILLGSLILGETITVLQATGIVLGICSLIIMVAARHDPIQK
ncbi:MAG: DMT family transporter [Proteobacteria bacterium]|nr:DMT family transporter [Pseudomonadota bacterium]